MPMKSKRSTSEFLTKFFLEGQELDEKLIEQAKQIPENATFEEKLLTKYRKFVAFLIPFTISQSIYWITAFRYDFLPLFLSHWQMPAVMVIGATIAGMTSAGGGAVAFPVMTFVLKMTPEDARDFSIMIQSVGMSMAMFTIIFMRIQIDWHAICYGIFGALPGVIIGFHWLDPLFTAAQKKMMFVAIFAAFTISLYLLNREQKRKTFPVIEDFKPWKALVLLVTGFFGGVFTAFSGTGLDMTLFSVITLLFRVSEKTATPTTVVSMGLLSQFCFYWRGVFMADINALPLNYLKVCAPIAVTFAPLGSFLGSHFHRLVLAWALYIVEFLAIIGFLFTRPALSLLIAAFVIVACSMAFFICLSKLGDYLMKKKPIELGEIKKLSTVDP